MRTIAFALALLSLSAFAQQGSGPDNGGITRGNFLRIPDYKTTGTATWFLDPAGSDSNNCTSATSPCQTILGLQAKMPKLVRNPTTITMAAGNYSGGWFTNFGFDPASSSVGAYVVLKGTLSNFAPATGTATGTASSAIACSLGPPLVDASLTDGSQAWTTNNLRGQLIETTGGTGSGQIIPIDSNTATTITIAGCWGTTPNATTTYAIRTWDAVINSTVTYPPDYVNAAAGAVGLGVNNMDSNSRSNLAGFFFIDSVRVQVTSSSGSLVVSDANTVVLRSRFDTTAGPGVSIDGNSRFQFLQSVATSTTLAAFGTLSFRGASPGVRVANSYFESGTTSGSVVSLLGLNYSGGNTFSNSFGRATNSGALGVVTLNASGTGIVLSGWRSVCTTGGSTAGLIANMASNSSPWFPAGPIGVNWDSNATRECPIGISASGSNVQVTTDDSTFQATAGTTALAVSNGATVNLDTNSAVSGSFTTQVSLDNGAVTSLLSDVATNVYIRHAPANTGVTSIP